MSQTATNRPSAKLVSARLLGALLPDLQRTDLVYAVLPDGEELLVKGRKRLEQIATGTRAVVMTQSKVPVPEIEAAIGLEWCLGSDGDLVRRVFGNVLIGGAAGHA